MPRHDEKVLTLISFSPAGGRSISLSARCASGLIRWGLLAVAGLLAACSAHHETADVDQSNEAQAYIARARGDYTPPGPPEDPWGPYIHESAQRFDVPETWIREVMRVESGGNQYRNGQLMTSWAGAMGLMQVMPETYDDLRIRYDLSDDAFDPHNNILAGTAYMREMYDIYGMPGFLAAYNAGPKRLDDYLANERPLPDETRHYVAMIAPYIAGVYPQVRSPAEDYAMNDLPTDIPPGLRYGGGYAQVAHARPAHSLVRTARAEHERKGHGVTGAEVRLVTATSPASAHRHGFHLINSAMAEPIPVHRGGKWFVPAGAEGGQKQKIATEHSTHHPATGCGKPVKGHACQSVASAH